MTDVVYNQVTAEKRKN